MRYHPQRLFDMRLRQEILDSMVFLLKGIRIHAEKHPELSRLYWETAQSSGRLSEKLKKRIETYHYPQDERTIRLWSAVE